MKKIIALLLCICIIPFTHAQKNTEEKIKEIRKEYYRIHSELKNFEVIKYMLPDSMTNYTTDVYFTGYFENGALKLLKEEKDWHSFSQNESYYFKNGNIFFVFKEYSNFNNEYQERFYFDDLKLIKALRKEKTRSDSIAFPDIKNKIHPCFGQDKNQTAYDYAKAKKMISKFYNYKEKSDPEKDKKQLMYLKKLKNQIQTEKSVYRIERVNYISEAYWYNTSYTAYFDKSDNLKLLTFSLSDEGYSSDYEYYFNMGEVFYIYRDNFFEPDDEASQEKIYIYNGKVLTAFIKKKTLDDKTPFSEIKAKVTKEIDKYYYQEMPAMELRMFYEAKEKKE